MLQPVRYERVAWSRSANRGEHVLRRLLFVLALAAPLAAWALVKPVRTIAPQLEGLTCADRVCVDDPSRRAEALALYREAADFVHISVGTLNELPRAVFCSTRQCAEKFGATRAQAYTVGTFAIVIGERAWRPYFVRHELIHHLQNERLGSLRNSFFKPVWFREGMAYSLSQDPRDPLPEPLQGYRARFNAWFNEVGPAELWAKAELL
jgi:hypothetical protein